MPADKVSPVLWWLIEEYRCLLRIRKVLEPYRREGDTDHQVLERILRDKPRA